MKVLIIIWLIFALLFGVLTFFHFRAAMRKIEPFEVSKRAYNKLSGIRIEAKIAGSDVDEPLKNFVEDFNSYIEKYNKSTTQQNLLAAVGYLAAAFTAVISMILSTRNLLRCT